jgi:hypothetical protein
MSNGWAGKKAPLQDKKASYYKERHAERSRSISTGLLFLLIGISCAVEMLRLRSA